MVNQIENAVEIKISETGIGISKDRLTKIFDRYYQVENSHTRDQEGTGIGLALTKELVELLGGRITVESPAHESLENTGSRFCVFLPFESTHNETSELNDN